MACKVNRKMGAFEQIIECITKNDSYVLEAGAGAGKTYTLIQTLRYLIDKFERQLKDKNQNIVCITYTNVAKNEVIERMQNNSLIAVSTIHEFLWSSINKYQTQLKEQLIILNKKMFEAEQDKFRNETPAKQENFKFRHFDNLEDRINNIEAVRYDDSNFRNFEGGLLEHDDIITISKLMFENYPLLTKIIVDKFPYIMVDEYQDTAKETVEILIDILLKENKNNILLGFYGDSHQKIYDTGIGSLQSYIDSKALSEIKKEENFRSSATIVNLLNKIRTNIQQKSQVDIEESSVKFIYYNNPDKLVELNDKGKPVEEKQTVYEKRIQSFKDEAYQRIVQHLSNNGWDIKDKGIDKILILTNSKVANRVGFGDLYKVFTERYSTDAKRRLLDREHSLVQVFVGYQDNKTSIERETGIEHLIQFWLNKDYNRVISYIKKQGNPNLVKLEAHSDKEIIYNLLNELIDIRNKGTIKEILDYVVSAGIIKLSDRAKDILDILSLDLKNIEDKEQQEKIKRDQNFISSFLNLPYNQIICLYEHIQNQTVFSTKHGTKGEEYRNVLVILDDTEWKQKYNFNKFFNSSEDNPNRLEMTKNLFYVSCSRAQKELIVLMLSSFDNSSKTIIENWFGKDNTIEINDYLQ